MGYFAHANSEYQAYLHGGEGEGPGDEAIVVQNFLTKIPNRG